MFKKRENQWGIIIKELWTRFINAIVNPTFLFYFASGIIIIGGIGVWLPYVIYKGTDNAIDFLYTPNLVTFTTALIGTMYVNSTLKDSNGSILKQPAIFFGLLAFIFSIYGYMSEPKSSNLWTTLGTCIALFLFILINVNDPIFDNEIESSSTGYEEASAEKLPSGGEND